MNSHAKFNVKLGLKNLLSKHAISGDDELLEDEVVVAYIEGILDAVADGGVDDDYFDLDDFIQTVAAYIPTFDAIPRNAVSEWIKLLSRSNEVTDVSDYKDTITDGNIDGEETRTVPSDPSDRSPSQEFHFYNRSDCVTDEGTEAAGTMVVPNGLKMLGRTVAEGGELKQPSALELITASNNDQTNSIGDIPGPKRSNGRVRGKKGRLKSQSSQSTTDSSEGNGSGRGDRSSVVCDEEDVRTLLELFPNACKLQVESCLRIEPGNIAAAADRLAQQQTKPQIVKPKKENDEVDEDKCDPKMRQLLMERYGYYDAREAETVHRPHLKHESKKMVRYLDSKVVNTKGQRFTDTRPPETDEMKKTYINLKPLKRYKKH